MKLINSRGRVLLEVEKARVVNDSVIYIYSGPGCGGCVDKQGLDETIRYIKLDNPSAKTVGFLPVPSGTPIVSHHNH